MPSPLKRIQVLCEPDLHAAIQTIARGRNMTLSATCAQMLGQLLNTPEMRDEYEKLATKFGAYEPQKDTRQKRNQQPHFKAYDKPDAPWSQQPGDDTISMNEKVQQRRVDRYNEVEAASVLPPGAPEGSIPDGAGGYLIPDGKGGYASPDMSEAEIQEGYAKAKEAGPFVTGHVTPEMMERAHGLFLDAAITKDQYESFVIPRELQPGEDLEAANRKEHAAKMQLLAEAEDRVATAKKLQEQDERMQRMEQMMSQMAEMLAKKS